MADTRSLIRPKIHLVAASFGNLYRDAVPRLTRQANSMEIFDTVTIVTDSNIDKNLFFELSQISLFNSQTIGYGWWLWKSVVVDYYLKKISSGDIIFYCDVGVELNNLARPEFVDLIHKCISRGALFFKNNGQQEYKWTKKEVLDYFNAGSNVVKTDQIQATCFFMIKNSLNTKLVSEWKYLSLLNNGMLISSEIPNSRQYLGFKAHRHDQSLLSVLVKLKRLNCIDDQINYPMDLYYARSYLGKYPIHALRNKSADSILECINERNVGLFSFLNFVLARIFLYAKRRI